MTVVAITSSRTSPGATSLATGLAVARSHAALQTLLIEADPAGGVLSSRFGLAPAPSLDALASERGETFSPKLVWNNTQDLHGVRCIPGPADPRTARSWIERAAPTLITELPTLGVPTVIDLGWVDEGGASAPLAAAADTTLVVTSTDPAEVQALLFQVHRLQSHGANVALVTVGDTPRDPREIAVLAGVPLAAALPQDPAVAAALVGGTCRPTKFRRSLLWREITSLAGNLLDSELAARRTAPASYPAPVGLTPFPHPFPTTMPLTPRTAAPQPTQAREPAGVASAPRDIRSTEPERDQWVAIDPGLFDETKRMPRRNATAVLLRTGQGYPLDEDSASLIGRHSGCRVLLRDSQVSRRHGRISRTAEGWYYNDLGSRNGTHLNGRLCTDALLAPGDVLTLGRTELTFHTTSV